VFVCLSVYVSVCLSVLVTQVSPSVIAEQVAMPFGGRITLGTILDGH